MSSPVRFDADRVTGVGTLLLDRPAASNALDLPTATALAAAVRAARAEEGLRALHITSSGPRFCVGGDVRAFASQEAATSDYLGAVADRLHEAILGLAELPAPIVASVRGSAAGAGFAIAMSADLVLCAPDARFVLAYSALGLTPDGGSSWFLSRLVGYRRAVELALLNPVVDAREAVTLGLATRVCDDLDTSVHEQLDQLAAGPALAYARTRRLLRGGTQHDLATHLELERSALLASAASADGGEGIRAFAGRRAATFQGA